MGYRCWAMGERLPTEPSSAGAIDALTAEQAWRLVLQRGARREGGASCRDDPSVGIALEVDGRGGWQCDRPVTPAAREVFDLYLPLAVDSSIRTLAQLGQSVDGRIATRNGASRYVTGSADLRHLHRLRALVDVVVIGAGTACADDPALTVRHTEGDNPTRVVIDAGHRVPEHLQLFHDDAAPTVLIHTADATRHPPGQATCLAVARTPEGGLDPQAILDALAARGLTRVLVEGGGVTVSRFLQAGLLDRLHLTVAPLIIGSGRAAFTLPAIDALEDALRPPCRHFRLGDDILFDFDLRRSP